MTGLKRTLRSRSGFTLVELIVVLVILGTTATFAVPALTGYIDSSKEKKAVSEAQACVETATQLAAAQYAITQQGLVSAQLNGSSAPQNNLNGWAPENSNPTTPEIKTGDIALTEGRGEYRLHVTEKLPNGSFPGTGDKTVFTKQADVSGTISKMTFTQEGVLLYLVYTSADGIQVVYTNSASQTTVKNDENIVAVPTPKATETPTAVPEPTATAKPTDKPTETPSTEPTPTATSNSGTGYITIEMYDENGKPLSDCTMHLDIYYVNNTASSEWSDTSKPFPIKDEDSANITQNMVSNMMSPYIVVQTQAPEGYQRVCGLTFAVDKLSNANDGKHCFRTSECNIAFGKVKFDDSDPLNLKVKIYCQPMQKLTIHKIDEYGNPLRGATFQIKNSNNTVNYTVTTNASGDAYVPMEVCYNSYFTPTPNCINSGEYGTFTVQEISSPYGYAGESAAVFWQQTNPDTHIITPHINEPYDKSLISYNETDKTVTFKNRKQDVDTGNDEANSSFGSLTITGVSKWKHQLSTANKNGNVKFTSGDVYSYENGTTTDYYFMTEDQRNYPASQYKDKPDTVPSPEKEPFNMLNGKLVKLTGNVYKKGDVVATLKKGDILIWQQEHTCPRYDDASSIKKHCTSDEHKYIDGDNTNGDTIFVYVYTGSNLSNVNTASIVRPSGTNWHRLNTPRCYFPG